MDDVLRLSRRDLLTRVAAAPLALLPAGPLLRAPDGLRLLAHGRLRDAAAEGLRFGVAEASVTASLMGRELQLGTSAAEIRGAVGVLAAEPPGDDAIPAATPVLLLRDLPAYAENPCAFRLRLSDRERQDALDRWRAATPEAAKIREPRVVEWHPSLFRYGAAELNDRYRKQTGTGMTADAWLAWFGVKALVDHALRASGGSPCQTLAAARFDGHKGRPLVFDAATRRLRQPVYIVSGEAVVGEVS